MDPTDTEAIVRTTRRFFSGMYQQLLVLWGGGAGASPCRIRPPPAMEPPIGRNRGGRSLSKG
jgi:hypothetical protein